MEIENYIHQLPEEKQAVFLKLRKLVLENIPTGFEEGFEYGMVAYVVPLSTYPKGYHCKANTPLPFISLAAQKNHFSFSHMGLYADEQLMEWFKNEFTKRYTTKLDIGKSCMRFKKENDIPFELLAELLQKVTPTQWIEQYERVFRK